jgi:hypothetical protein
MLGFDIDKYKLKDKIKVLRNCVVPEAGLAIFEQAMGVFNENKAMQIGLFENNF